MLIASRRFRRKERKKGLRNRETRVKGKERRKSEKGVK